MKEFCVKRSGRSDWEEVVEAESIRKAAESFVLATSVKSSDKILVVENKGWGKGEKQTYVAADLAWRSDWEVDDGFIKPEEEVRKTLNRRKEYIEQLRLTSNYNSLRVAIDVFAIVATSLSAIFMLVVLFKGIPKQPLEGMLLSLGSGALALLMIAISRLGCILVVDYMESVIDQNAKDE